MVQEKRRALVGEGVSLFFVVREELLRLYSGRGGRSFRKGVARGAHT